MIQPTGSKKLLLNVGNTWDNELYRAFYCHDGKDVVVDSLYGSIPGFLPSARPDWRLPDVSVSQVEKHIATIRDCGWDANWTLNPICLGNLEDFQLRWASHKERIRHLIGMGVNVFTVAHPLLIHLLCSERNDREFTIELSTVLEAFSPEHLYQYHKTFGNIISRICLPVHRNRDIAVLREFAAAGEETGIEPELMVNEFCSIDGAPCLGMFRTSCFQNHAHGTPPGVFDSYPMNFCTEARKDVVSWLKARFILPSMLQIYRGRTGIRRFKVTGRTHPTSYVIDVTRHYLSQVDPENLLELWAHLQTFMAATKAMSWEERQKIALQEFFISTGKLTKSAFFSRWFSDGWICADHSCTECGWCGLMAKAIQ